MGTLMGVFAHSHHRIGQDHSVRSGLESIFLMVAGKGESCVSTGREAHKRHLVLISIQSLGVLTDPDESFCALPFRNKALPYFLTAGIFQDEDLIASG